MRPLLLATSLLLVGCGRLHFEPGFGVDAGDGGGVGDRPDTAFGDCWPAWRNGTVRFGPPRQLAEVGTGFSELDPTISGDARTLYFARGLSGTRDIFVAMRPDRTSTFGPAAASTELNTAQDEGKLTMTGDELSLVIASDRTGSQAIDFWQLSRATTADQFAGATQAPLANVNTTANERDPHLSSDGLRLYYAAPLLPGQEIRVAARASLAAPFDLPSKVGDLGFAITADPSLSPDELVIAYIGAADTGSTGQLFYATRTATAAPFANPQPVPDVGSTADDGDPQLTADGCELFFSSTRTGNQELFVAPVQ